MKILENWNHILKKHCIEDIHYYNEYANLYGKAIAFYKKNNNSFGLLIIIVNKEFNDFETPYGYGGYISNDYSKEFSDLFFNEFKSIANSMNLIAGIIRLNPLYTIETNTIDIEYIRDIAIIDNVNSFENYINKKSKNMIKRALKNSVDFSIASNVEDYLQFAEHYRLSMKKKHADKFIIFDNKYFKQLYQLPFSYLFLAKRDKRIIGGAIFLIDKVSYYHLAFSERIPGISNYLVYMGLNKAKELKSNICILGGGIDKNDSLLKFKLSFANKLKPFYLGKIIINYDKYIKIKDKYKNIPSKYKHYFLSHRYYEEK